MSDSMLRTRFNFARGEIGVTKVLWAIFAFVSVMTTILVWAVVAIWAGHIVVLPPVLSIYDSAFWTWLAIIWVPPLLSAISISFLLRAQRGEGK